MPKTNKIYVIGIGYRPLSNRAKEILGRAELILASSRLFDVFKRYDEFETVNDRIKVINKVPETIDFIKERFSHSAIRQDPSPPFSLPLKGRGRGGDAFVVPQSAFQSVVLLASGDPLFFGIGRRMAEEFGKETVEILPDLSSVQEAFARVNEPWDDAFFISLHGGPDIAKRRKLPYEAGDIPQLLERYGKLGVLTDRENNPVLIAKVLQSAVRTPDRITRGQAPQSAILMSVCERLGYPEEKITRGSPEEIAGMSFADPNMVIIQKTGDRRQRRDEGHPALAKTRVQARTRDEENQTTDAALLRKNIRFGLTEDDILHSRGLITKDEVRAVTLHKLRLPQAGIFWDIGAGSGSVSLEAARLCPGLRIFAVEKELERIDTIRTNMDRHNVRNVEIIRGSAPVALTNLPAPDRVFVGGSGGNLNDIMKITNGKMPEGIIVINAATLETLHDALSILESNGFSVEVSEISVSRSKILAGKRQMNALNPVFIVRGEKG